jgi:acetolactate synthase-1/3 small subunit
VKVVVPPAVRNEVLSIVEPFRATVVDMSKNVTTFQVTGDQEKIEAFIDLMRPYGVKELTRTGVSAFVRETQKAQTPQLNIR